MFLIIELASIVMQWLIFQNIFDYLVPANSVLVFGSCIGMMSRLVTSSRGSLMQICRRFIHDKISADWVNCNSQNLNTKLGSFINDLIENNKKCRIPRQQFKSVKPTHDEKLFLDNNFNVIIDSSITNIEELSSATKNSLIFLPEKKGKLLKCSNYLAVLKNNIFVKIIRIFRFRSIILLSVKIINVKSLSNQMEANIVTYQITSICDSIKVFKFDFVVNMCVLTEVCGKKYLIPLCKYEHS